MVCFRRAFLAVTVTAALMVLAAPASAQAQVVTYSLAGIETAATSTEGSFVGVAISNDDVGTWAALVVHDPLDDDVPITGGAFAINGQVRDLQGVITDGEIRRLSGSCRKETFRVTGEVLLSTGDLGEFVVTLTHYGQRVPGGGCVTFFATVEGSVTFTLS